jgi:sulfoxide reductase heme-binding subunit YedZ
VSVGYTWVQWNRHKRIYDLILLAGVVLYLAVFFIVSKLIWTGANAISDEILIIRSFGTLAIVMLHVVLVIGPLARIDRRFLPLLYNRRHLGVATFLVALVHGLISLGYYHGFGTINPLVSILSANTEFDSVTQFPFELFGIAGLIILFFMAATSHDFWNRNLGPSSWKALHMLVYLAYALLIMHIALGALQKEYHPIYVALLALGVVSVVGLHLAAGWREWQRDRAGVAADADWVDIGPVDEIEDSRAKVVILSGGERVAVFRHGEALSAVTNVCRHQGGPVGEGRIVDGCITCPWHGWQYRPADGQSPPPFTERIETYNLRVEGGRILLDPKPNPPGTPVEPAQAAGGRKADSRGAVLDDFYVGYRDAPAAQRRFVRLVAPLLIVTAGLVGAGLAGFQEDPGTGQWLVGEPVRVEGTLLDRPYPMLITERDGRPETILLVGNGKFGAADQVGGFTGSRVRVEGVPITRDGMRILELRPSERTITELPGPAAMTDRPSLGTRTLQGEVIDPKCYFGAMKPGEGKTHKACAILCIRGGIPPMYATREADGSMRYYLLTTKDGGPAHELVIPHVGEATEVTGEVEQGAGVLHLRVDADSFRPL